MSRIVLKSGFVNERVGLQVSHEDLDEWECCLDALQAEEGVEWPAGDRSAWADVVPDDPVEVTVHDSPSTQIAVRVPIDVASGWLRRSRSNAAPGSRPDWMIYCKGLVGDVIILGS
ncbi:DUF5959 family protein [Streptomyces sp. NBC_00151]|uniref:DUF5959 family protein n=1 Tax=Streptomyces sp. NBC_00151 TaxID=2975669 RepID=UPI002DD8A37A|nr:DUF5959 family protein [Streptomyces sp. NBC_00151]WRZ37141.1 DUF5959 family protein [Streptomyces sp. NBC_00151]